MEGPYSTNRSEVRYETVYYSHFAGNFIPESSIFGVRTNQLKMGFPQKSFQIFLAEMRSTVPIFNANKLLRSFDVNWPVPKVHYIASDQYFYRNFTTSMIMSAEE